MVNELLDADLAPGAAAWSTYPAPDALITRSPNSAMPLTGATLNVPEVAEARGRQVRAAKVRALEVACSKAPSGQVAPFQIGIGELAPRHHDGAQVLPGQAHLEQDREV